MVSELEKNRKDKYEDEGIDLYEIFKLLWNKKIIIISLTFSFSILSILYSLSLPNIYKSESLLAPSEAETGMSGMLGQYAGMASLAGISMPRESGNKSKEAITRINSYEFFSKYFLPEILLEDLIAYKEWNPESNTAKYDKNIFDSNSQKWVRKASFPRSVIPSPQEAYKKYRKIMSIDEDKVTAFVSLSIKHQSPLIAKEWNEIIIKAINKSMRDQDKLKATKSVNFLNKLTLEVNYDEIKRSISSLQQEQMKQLMMIEANEDYIYKILDAPIAPELKSEPKRSVLVILTTLFGFFLSIFLIFVKDYSRNKKR